jgi:thiamine biosynthesis lipoprotein
MKKHVDVEAVAEGWCGRFEAMASPCEVLLDGGDATLARALTQAAQAEALRIEHAFSRYRSDSSVARIHASAGRAIEVDAETSALLDFAAQCHQLSEGLFDITSGVLRHAWRFDGSDRLPAPEVVAALQEQVGWGKLTWRRPMLTLPKGMEIDFGGIGKEYAVDRVIGLMRARTSLPVLINFGGDLAVTGARAQGKPWRIGVEKPDDSEATVGVLHVHAGAIATSGDARRFLLKDGVRYGHILDPHTGWPVVGAPRSVTVAAPTCTEAGLLSTLALLQGPKAEQFLCTEGVPHWILW